jgi:hypothetical protein
MASDNGSAPTTERGTAVTSVYNWTGVLPWSQFMDDAEKAPDLQWPRSIQNFDQMRNDAQCQGLYLGATAALRRYGWYVDPNGCDPAWVALLAADLNLPIGEAQARQQLAAGSKGAKLRNSNRFGWYHHLAMCLRALYYGHFYFEQVGTIVPDAPGGGERWQLRKLGPRHPRTITEIKVADDGGLVSITQGYGKAGQPPPEIPVDRLVAYVWDQDPGNWVGRSIYRPMYRNWLVKDRLLRVDAIKHERNGVGMPIVEAPPGATKPDIQELDQMAQEYKAGERGGGAVPYQTKLRLVGTEGSIPDTIASIRFHNEEMARSMLMMFMQLGQTETGSRALGESFIDWFQEQQTYIADWVVGVTTEHVIEDWWDWNVDPSAVTTPRLGYVTDAQSAPARGDFASAQLPPEVEGEFTAAWQRRQRARQAHTHKAQDDLGTDLPGAMNEPTGGIRLPNRKLHRQPYAHEIQAAGDFEDQEADEEAAEDALNKKWDEEKEGIVDKVADEIKKTADATDAASIAAAAGMEIVKSGAAASAESAAQAAAKGAAQEFAAQQLEARLPYDLEGTAEEVFSEILTGVGASSFHRTLRELRAQAFRKGLWYLTWPLESRGVYRTAIWSARLGFWFWLGSNTWSWSRDALSGLRSGLTAQINRLTASLAAAAENTEQVAERMRDEILGTKGTGAGGSNDQIRGAVHRTTNQTRVNIYDQVIAGLEPGESLQLYASELLDINTCPACAYIDGQQLTIAQAKLWYGGGSYLECDGGPRCRGTVVAVYEGERSYT